MHSLSIWSLSNHLQKKTLPSIQSNKKIKIISILTNKKKIDLKLKKINLYKDKKKFFQNDKFDFVYISSINSKHYQNTKFALENKKNVICEKPISLNKAQLNNLFKIAKKNKKKFFEVIQYTNHPLFKKLKKIINNQVIGKISYVKSSFKIPLNDKNNFRFKNKLGGGALNDVGFYPISIMFTLFDSRRIEILKSKITKKNNLDINGSISTKNENKILFELDWGFKSLYQNNIKIFGTDGVIEVNFIYSKNIKQNGKIKIFKTKKSLINVPNANQINLAFNEMLSAKKSFFNKRYKLSLQIINIIEKLKKKI
mgnify:CR=1 FL=1|tara:strand:- start:111 stop:1046 length:936 start_codon:yes stop_codon:yes gene_type:complete